RFHKKILTIYGHVCRKPPTLLRSKWWFLCFLLSCYRMPQCLKCGAELQVNEEGVAPVLCDRCAGIATSKARRGLSTGTLWDYPATTILVGINVAVLLGMIVTGGLVGTFSGPNLLRWGANVGPLTYSGEYWRLITAGFVHGSFSHILFNMWALW